MSPVLRIGTAVLAGVVATFGLVSGLASPAAAAVTAEDVLEAFASGGELTLDQDVTVDETLTLGEGVTLTLDLAGHELTVSGEDGPAGPPDPGTILQQVAIMNGGDLIVQNGALTAIGGNGGDGEDGTVGADGEDGGFGAPGIYSPYNSRLALLDVDLAAIGGSGGTGGAGGDGADGSDGGDGGQGGTGAPAVFATGVTLLTGGSENVTGGTGGAGGSGGAGDDGGITGVDGAPGPDGSGWGERADAVTLDGNGADGYAQMRVHAYDFHDALEGLDALPTEWPTRADHALVGWFTAPAAGERVDEDTVVAGQTIYAQWDEASECTPTTFALALSTAADGSTVTLCGDITVEPGDHELQVPAARSVTLDLAGHELTVTGRWQRPALGVGADATLTIEDSVGGGTLDATAGASQAAIELGPRPETATLIVNSGTIIATATEEYGDGAGIGGSGGDNGGTVIINGGTVYATGTGDSPGIGGTGGNSMVGNNPQPITINGGEVHATGGTGIGGGLDTGSGEITINGGLVYATGAGAGIGGGQGWDVTSTVTITGGEVHVVVSAAASRPYSFGRCASSPKEMVTPNHASLDV